MKKLLKLGSLADFVMGQAPASADCNGDGRGVPFVKAGEFGDLRPIIREWTTDPLKLAKSTDVLICVVGATAGKLNLGADCAIGRSVAAIRPRTNLLDQSFLFHLLKTKIHTLRGGSQGSAQGVITSRMLNDVQVPNLCLSDQQRIATILDKADSLRRKRQEAIRLADDFLRAVFIDMFRGLDDGSLPLVELADVVTVDAPMVDPTSDEFADMLHVGPDRIEKGNGQLAACETARAEGLTSKKFLFDERYVLYSKIRPALKKCALAEFRGLCSADMYPVRPSGNEVTREFIWGLLLSDAFDRYVGTLPDRANIPKLNRVELNAFQFRLPSIESQHKYSSVVKRTMALKRQHYTFLKQASALPASLGFFN